MISLWERLLGRTSDSSSAQKAKERLKFVLIHDRTDISPDILEKMKDEIIAVISRHVNIDRNAVQINLTQDKRANRLVANIPLIPVGRKHGI